MTTLARQLAKRALRSIPVPVPPAVRPHLREALERQLGASAAVLALEERTAVRKEAAKDGDPFDRAPPLTEDEWLQLHELIASGPLPTIASLAAAEREIMKLAKIELRIEAPDPLPRWRIERAQADAFRRAPRPELAASAADLSHEQGCRLSGLVRDLARADGLGNIARDAPDGVYVRRFGRGWRLVHNGRHVGCIFEGRGLDKFETYVEHAGRAVGLFDGLWPARGKLEDEAAFVAAIGAAVRRMG